MLTDLIKAARNLSRWVLYSYLQIIGMTKDIQVITKKYHDTEGALLLLLTNHDKTLFLFQNAVDF